MRTARCNAWSCFFRSSRRSSCWCSMFHTCDDGAFCRRMGFFCSHLKRAPTAITVVETEEVTNEEKKRIDFQTNLVRPIMLGAVYATLRTLREPNSIDRVPVCNSIAWIGVASPWLSHMLPLLSGMLVLKTEVQPTYLLIT